MLMELQEAKYIDKHLMDLLFDAKNGLPTEVARHIKWAFHEYESYSAVDVFSYMIDMGEDDHDHIRELREEVESELRKPKPISMEPIEWRVRLEESRSEYRQLNSGRDIDTTDKHWHHRIVTSFSNHEWFEDLKYHISMKLDSGHVYDTVDLWEEINSFYHYKESSRVSKVAANVTADKKGRGRGRAKGSRGGKSAKNAHSASPISKHRKSVHAATRGRKRARSESSDRDRDHSLSPDGHKHARPKSERDKAIAKKNKNARTGSERWARQKGKNDAHRREEHKKDLPLKRESIFRGNKLNGGLTHDGNPRQPSNRAHSRATELIKRCRSYIDIPKSSKDARWRCKGCKLQDCRGVCTTCFVSCNHKSADCQYEKGNAEHQPKDSVLSGPITCTTAGVSLDGAVAI